MEGVLDRDRLEKIKIFLEQNVAEDSESKMHDAGYTIEYTKGDKKIVVKNNVKVWEKLMDMITEYYQ